MEYSCKMVFVPQDVYDAMMKNTFQPGTEHTRSIKPKRQVTHFTGRSKIAY